VVIPKGFPYSGISMACFSRGKCWISRCAATECMCRTRHEMLIGTHRLSNECIGDLSPIESKGGKPGALVAAQHRIASSLGERHSQAEAHYHVPVVSRISLARGWAKESSGIKPRPTTIRAETIFSNFICAPIGWHPFIAFGITIFSPLPDISYDVMETE